MAKMTGHPLEEKLLDAWKPKGWQELTVLLAVSGGADSVALLRAMKAIKSGGSGRILAAHFNHGLRDKDSDADQAFVIDLCRRLGVACHLGCPDADHPLGESGDNLEAAARAARYEFLQKTAARLGARYVVTAHTADDQAETILHRIIRGTGIAGLSGMARARPLGEAATLIRPLLQFRRAELIAYLEYLGQPYRHDHSNDDTRFTRNRIRHHLLPELALHINPGVVDALLRLGSLAGQLQDVVHQLVVDLAEQCVIDDHGGSVRIDLGGLVGQSRYVIRELLIAVWRRQDWPMQSMGFSQWDLLAEMILDGIEGPMSEPRKQTFPGQVLAELHDSHLLLRRPHAL